MLCHSRFGGVVRGVVEVGLRCRYLIYLTKRTKSAAEPDLNKSKLWNKQNYAVAVAVETKKTR